MRAKLNGRNFSCFAVAIGLTMTGCDTLKDSSKQDLLASGGAGACAAASTLVTEQLPVWMRGLVVIGSAAGCGFVGKQIGAYLDESDRQKMNVAAQETLKTGKVQRWQSPDGKKGSTKLVSNPPGTAEGCQTMAQSLTLADGSTKSENVTVCGNGDTGQDPVIQADDASPSDEGYLDWMQRKASEATDTITDAL